MANGRASRIFSLATSIASLIFEAMFTSRLLLFWPISILALQGCSTGNGASTAQTIFTGQTREIRYEVDYMTGAEPFVGDAPNGAPIWYFLRTNISALFDSTKTVTVPTTLDDMQAIPAGGTDYSQSDILALADTYRDHPAFENGVTTIYVLFLDGYFVSDEKTDSSVLGVSIGDTSVIAIFKPAITAGTFATLFVGKFVEQSVLIHESGHALGLVNNGLALTSAHQDAEHGAHCTNDRCVMYYLNEGIADLVEFLQQVKLDGDTVIFGDECLNDAHAAL
ncbi:MAG TPA: hypothetical protein VI895_06105 [Bdellovibrionota bacterium]|nr:hypothetical protein [Bdellovibrionota bacterium]